MPGKRRQTWKYASLCRLVLQNLLNPAKNKGDSLINLRLRIPAYAPVVVLPGRQKPGTLTPASVAKRSIVNVNSPCCRTCGRCAIKELGPPFFR